MMQSIIDILQGVALVLISISNLKRKKRKNEF